MLSAQNKSHLPPGRKIIYEIAHEQYTTYCFKAFIVAIFLISFVFPQTAFAKPEKLTASEQVVWEFTVNITDLQASALDSAEYDILETLVKHEVAVQVEAGKMILSGTQGMEQLRQAVFEDLNPVVDFLGGKIVLTIYTPEKLNGFLDLQLESRIATGYVWKVSQEDLKTFSQNEPYRIEQRYPGPSAPGVQIFQVQTSSEAENKLQLTYQRSFEPSAPVYGELNIRFNEQITNFDLTDPNPTILIDTSITADLNQDNPIEDIPLTDSLPTAFDWRTQGVVPAIRDQGGCGGCWAFGTVGVMESTIKIAGGAMTDLSEQFLISCNNSDWGCDGGLTAHKYHYDTLGKNQTQVGAVLETDKPYIESDGTCSVAYNHPYQLDDWEFVTGSEWTVPTDEQIKNAIYTYGPITAGVCVGANFNQYTTGVLTVGDNCGSYTNHQIILVGWDDSTESWILRNTWGTSWGESGYMRIKYGISRVGEGTSWVTYTAAPDAPTGVAASDGTYTDKVTVSWNAAASATYYQVYRNTSNTTSGASQLTANDTASPYEDTSAVPGTLYYYWVKACSASGCSDFSTSNPGWRSAGAITAPTNVSASNGTYSDKVRITWNGVGGATYYQVYRNTSNTTTGATQIINNHSAVSFDDSSAVVDTTYYYWIKACNASTCSSFSTSDAGVRSSVKHTFLPLTIKSGTSGPSSIKNGDFEAGQNGDWTEFSSYDYDIINDAGLVNGLDAHSGSWIGWFGGAINDTSQLSQAVSISSANPYLHYWYWVGSEDVCGFDYFYVKINGTTKQTINLCENNNTGNWVKGVLNLFEYSGSTVNLMFEAATNGSSNSNLFLDDVSLSSSGVVTTSDLKPELINVAHFQKPAE